MEGAEERGIFSKPFWQIEQNDSHKNENYS
jgi:hypothetical protein